MVEHPAGALGDGQGARQSVQVMGRVATPEQHDLAGQVYKRRRDHHGEPAKAEVHWRPGRCDPCASPSPGVTRRWLGEGE
jgi:hypothetical protein